MKNKIFPIFLLLAFLFHPGFFELNSESVKTKKDQEGLQQEVVVTLKLVQVHVTDKKGNPRPFLFGKDQTLLKDYEEMVSEFAASNSPVHTASTIGPGTEPSLQMLSEITGGQIFTLWTITKRSPNRFSAFPVTIMFLGTILTRNGMVNIMILKSR